MYAIYCPDMKGKFRPLDLVNNTTTRLRMNASVFNTREEAKKVAAYLQECNVGVPFEVRKF